MSEVDDLLLETAVDALQTYQETLQKAIDSCPKSPDFIAGMQFAHDMVDMFISGMDAAPR